MSFTSIKPAAKNSKGSTFLTTCHERSLALFGRRVEPRETSELAPWPSSPAAEGLLVFEAQRPLPRVGPTHHRRCDRRAQRYWAGPLWLAIRQIDSIAPFPATHVSAIVKWIALGVVAVAIVVGVVLRRPHPGRAADRELTKCCTRQALPVPPRVTAPVTTHVQRTRR